MALVGAAADRLLKELNKTHFKAIYIQCVITVKNSFYEWAIFDSTGGKGLIFRSTQ